MAENVVVQITANLKDNAQGGLRGLRQRLTSLKESSRGVQVGLQAVKVGAAAVGATVGVLLAAGGAALALTNQYAAQAAELGKLSLQTGTQVEQLSVLKFAFQGVGADVEDLGAILAEINIKVGDAADGAEDTGRAFSQLGLDWRELRNQSPDETFQQIVTSLGEIENASLRTNIADRIFGGDDARKVLALVGTDFTELAARAKELGVVLDNDAAVQAKAFQVAMNELRLGASGIAVQLGKVLVPILTVLARKALPIVVKAVQLIAPLFEFAAKAVAFFVGGLLDLINFILDVVRPVLEPFIGLLQNLGQAFGLAASEAPAAAAGMVDIGLAAQEATGLVGEAAETQAGYLTSIGTAACFASASANSCLGKIGDVGNRIRSNVAKSTEGAFNNLIKRANETGKKVNDTLVKAFDTTKPFEAAALNTGSADLTEDIRAIERGGGTRADVARRLANSPATFAQGRERQSFLEQNFFGDEQNRQALIVELNRLGAMREQLANIGQGATNFPGPPFPFQEFERPRPRPPVNYDIYANSPQNGGFIGGPGNYPIYGNRTSPVQITIQAETIIGADQQELAERITTLAEQGFVSLMGRGGEGAY